jgi:hypothetical protein
MNKHIVTIAAIGLLPQAVIGQGPVRPEFARVEQLRADLAKIEVTYQVFNNQLNDRLGKVRCNCDLGVLMAMCQEGIHQADETCRKASAVEQRFRIALRDVPAGQQRDVIEQQFYDGFGRLTQTRVDARVGLLVDLGTHRWTWEKGKLHIKGWVSTLVDNVLDPENHTDFPHLRYLARLEMMFEGVARAFLEQ